MSSDAVQKAKSLATEAGLEANGRPKVPKAPLLKPEKLVEDLKGFVRTYVVMSNEQLLVVALWVIHTYCADAAEQTPYLSVMSPEPRCGKSRLVEVLNLLVCNPWKAVIPSEAVLYRKIELESPTLLLDEIDTIFNPKTADRYEGHRAVLNEGHRRGAKVDRMVGTTGLAEFNVFCPKLLAGIGSLPTTVADRSVPIRLKRRTRSEAVSRFIHRDVAPLAEPFKARIEAWAESNIEELKEARPEMPEEINDRMQEGCECLVAIADGLDKGEEARAALVELLAEERVDDVMTFRLRLLADLRTIFEAREAKQGGLVRGISTKELLVGLTLDADGPWREYYGRGSITPHDVASLLSHFNVGPKAIKVKGETFKGYRRDDLNENWDRYLEAPLEAPDAQ